MKKVLELQLSFWGSCNFKIYPILFVFHSYFEHYTYKGVWSSNFTLRNLCTWNELIKRLNPKTKKEIMHISKVLTFPTYLSTNLDMYLVRPTHLGRPMYLFT
jgi:hypothetical protein